MKKYAIHFVLALLFAGLGTWGAVEYMHMLAATIPEWTKDLSAYHAFLVGILAITLFLACVALWTVSIGYVVMALERQVLPAGAIPDYGFIGIYFVVFLLLIFLFGFFPNLFMPKLIWVPVLIIFVTGVTHSIAHEESTSKYACGEKGI